MCTMTSKHLCCERNIEAVRCSRLQCRFWVCFLSVACVCLFLACIAMPTCFPSSAVLPSRWHGRGVHRNLSSFFATSSYGLLSMVRRMGSEESADLALPVLRKRSTWSSSRKLLMSEMEGDMDDGRGVVHRTSGGEAPRNFEVQRMGPEPAAAGGGGGAAAGRGPSSPSSLCSVEDIAIVQGEMGPMPDGIPSFAVQILNLCLGGCPIADIHVSCGWFASATLVNPALFKRVGFDDCLVKGGQALAAGETLSFQYANSFQYPFSLSSASFSASCSRPPPP